MGYRSALNHSQAWLSRQPRNIYAGTTTALEPLSFLTLLFLARIAWTHSASHASPSRSRTPFSLTSRPSVTVSHQKQQPGSVSVTPSLSPARTMDKTGYCRGGTGYWVVCISCYFLVMALSVTVVFATCNNTSSTLRATPEGLCPYTPDWFAWSSAASPISLPTRYSAPRFPHRRGRRL